MYAEAIKGYGGQWVPNIVMSGGGSGQGGVASNGNGAMDLISLLTAKTANELALDLKSIGKSNKSSIADQTEAGPTIAKK